MKLIVTIDTEEDNWANYSRTENSVENVERISLLQKLFDQFGIKPTYLVSYPVATSQRSISILRRILDEGKCEIGAHCHPWNTPPFDEEISEYNSMLCNLPEKLQYKKLECLHESICKNFGIVPVVFRAGRWGFGASVARSICRLGYRVDTSLTPYENWAVYRGPDFSGCDPQPFRFNPDFPLEKKTEGELLQVPATIGFLQRNYNLCHRLTQFSEAEICRKLHMKGILSRLRLLNKVWLSPEVADADFMVRLARRMIEKRYPCLNMSFHSTSLLAGLSPFVRSMDDEYAFIKKIKDFLIFASESGMECQTLSKFEVSFGKG
jgi:hypothetical protein